jgi:hypothetical protein
MVTVQKEVDFVNGGLVIFSFRGLVLNFFIYEFQLVYIS